MSEPTNAEINAQVAERVMEFVKTDRPDDATKENVVQMWNNPTAGVLVSDPYLIKGETLYFHQWRTFLPTESDADAMAVLRKCAEKIGPTACINIRKINDVWEVVAHLASGHPCAEAETPNLAICKFSLLLFP